VVPFDPYLNWLGIAPHEQPPHFYRLLGIVLFESNPEVIDQAADRQSLRVGAYQSGPQGEMCQQLLSEIAMARFCLSDPQQKAAYDSQLNEALSQRGERAVAAPPPPAQILGNQQFNAPAPQFGSPTPQFGVQSPLLDAPLPQFNQPPQFSPTGSAGHPQPGNAALGPMPMPGPAAMSSPPAMMQMPPAMMPTSQGFAPAMPLPSARTGMPMAAPFRRLSQSRLSQRRPQIRLLRGRLRPLCRPPHRSAD